jgi:hypothetical protein
MLGLICLAWLYLRKLKLQCGGKYHPSEEPVVAVRRTYELSERELERTSSHPAARRTSQVAVLVHNQLRKSTSKKLKAPSPSWKSIETIRLTSQQGASTIQFKNENLKAAATRARPAMPLRIASTSFVSLDVSRLRTIVSHRRSNCLQFHALNVSHLDL